MNDDLRAKLNGRRVIASISGGRDSAAMSLWLHEQGIDHDRVFMDTGWEHQLTYEHIRGELTRRLGPITELRADMDFVSLVRSKGIFPARDKRFCTEQLKVLPLARYFNAMVAAGHDIVNAVGIRRAESRARSTMLEWEWSDGFDCEVWRPLVAWTAGDVAGSADHRDTARVGARHERYLALARVNARPATNARRAHVIERVERHASARVNAERELNAAALAKLGEAPRWERTMFSYHGHRSAHVPLPIVDAVEWANSKRGEWQPRGAMEGCMRHGICETEDE